MLTAVGKSAANLMPSKAKIFLVDDHPLVRESLTGLIHQSADLAVCGEAADAQSALEKIGRAKPDLAIVDISLGADSGIDLIRSLREQFPEVQAIVLSMHDERVYAERAMRAGARGYIMKRESTGKIVDAIRQVLLGNLYLSKDLTELFAKKFVSGPAYAAGGGVDQLSDRELEVFQLMGQGYETRQIADTLKVNIKTVQTYCTRIKDKLKLSTGSELLREAVRWRETAKPD
jgi:DNA-binding NarL/FixJ family response regulator